MSLTNQDPRKLPRLPSEGAVTGHWSLTDNPHLLRALENSFMPAEGALNPAENWQLSFDVIFCGPQNFKKIEWVYQGWYEVRRTLHSDGTATIHGLDHHLLGPDPSLEWQRIDAQFTLNTDQLGTIPDGKTWTVKSKTIGQQDPESLNYSSLDEQSVLKSSKRKRIWKRRIGNNISFETALPDDVQVTSTLGLMDACQRFPEGAFDKIPFGIIRNGTSWCPGQHLNRLPDSTLRVPGRELKLRGFAQTGTGHLPTFFWIDNQNRLVAIRRGVLALIQNQSPVMKARCPHEA